MRAHSVTARWDSWDRSTHELLTLGWENGGWTADGVVAGPDIHYVVRLDEHWQVRQFLLFRDMEEPDLWLVTDGSGRWAEMNGDRRAELDGCALIDLACTPFTTGLAARAAGPQAAVRVARIDPETLAVEAIDQQFEPAAEGWLHAGGLLTVDEHHLVVDHQGWFRRVG